MMILNGFRARTTFLRYMLSNDIIMYYFNTIVGIKI